MDEQEQADRMAAAEALFMISTRGSKNKGEGATRRSKRGRKKQEIIEYDNKVGDILNDTTELSDEVRLNKAKRGQPTNDNVTKSSDDSRVGKVRTVGKKFAKNDVTETGDTEMSSHAKLFRPTPKKRHKVKAKYDNWPSESQCHTDTDTTSNNKDTPITNTQSSKPNKRLNRGKFNDTGTKAFKPEGTKNENKEIKALGFTGAPVTLSKSKSPPKIVGQTKPASPRRIPSLSNENSQSQLKSTDSASLPSSASLLSMNISTPEVVSLPSLPAGIGSLQLPSGPVPNLSSLTETKRSETSASEREESQKQLPLKKRKLLGAAQVEEEKMVEDISDAEEEVSSVGQVQATFTVQAPPIITMQTLMEIKTALTPDEDGDLPLHIAVVHENMRMVTKLINLMRIAVKGVDKFNKQQQTPLHLAVKLNFLPAVELLITSGGNINTVDWTGSSAIHMAVQGGFYDCLELILKQCPHAELNARNFEGLSPLHLAVISRDMKQVQLLLKFGADIDLPDGKSGRTALFHAAESNQKSLVELLLKQGANPDLTNYAGVTATMAAQGRNLHSILKLIGSVAQDKQDNKWNTLTVKNQSGSVMMVVDPSNDGRNRSGPDPGNGRDQDENLGSLLQRQHPVSSSLLQQGTKGSDKIMTESFDQSSRSIQNMVMISEPNRRISVDSVGRRGSPVSQQALSPLPSSPIVRPVVEIKVETEVLDSDGNLGSSSLSPSSISKVNVKQEVKDSSPEGVRVTVPLSFSSLSSSVNEVVILSKSTRPLIPTGAIGLSGKPIVRDPPGKLSNSGNGSSTSSGSLGADTKHQVPLGRFGHQNQQQSQRDVNKLSVPSQSPLSSSHSNPSSPRGSSSNLGSTSNSADPLTFTSNQARLYKKLLEMYKFNPSPIMPAVSDVKSGLRPLSPMPVLRSLPILPSSTSPLSSSSHPSSNSTSPPLSKVSSMPSKSPSQDANFQDRPSLNPPVLFQRSLSTQELPSDTMRCLTDKSLPQKVSVLKVSNPSALHPNILNLSLSRNEIHQPHLHHPRSQHAQRVFKYSFPPDTKNADTSTSAAIINSSDMPLNLSAKNYSSTTPCKDEKNVITSSSGIGEDLNKNVSKDDRDGLIVPGFPHITKSVSAKTASFVRNFLSQQKQHLQQQEQPERQNVSPSNKETISPSSPLVENFQNLRKNTKISKSIIDIPPLLTSSSSTTLSLTSTTSSLYSSTVSHPASPSSAVSTLSLPSSQLDHKKYLSVTKSSASPTSVAGSIIMNPSIPTLTIAVTTTTTTTTNPNFLHQAGRIIDLSTGDESQSGREVSNNNSSVVAPHSMEGKMVGFSGAIISIPSSSSSSSSSSSAVPLSLSVSVDKSNNTNKTLSSEIPNNSKINKSSASSLTVISAEKATKERVRRKGRRGGGGGIAGGVKSSQAPPISTATPVILHNKINRETDQRLKKFLGMKRSEQSGGSASSSSAVDKLKREMEKSSEVSTHRRPQSGTENGNKNNNNDSIIDKDDKSSSHHLQVGHGERTLNEDEPVIETVGIFSGNIQHVKVKSGSLKSIPLAVSSSSSSSSSSSASKSRIKKLPLSNTSNSIVGISSSESSSSLPSAITLSSWPLSSKQYSSSSSSLSPSLTSTTLKGKLSPSVHGERFLSEDKISVNSTSSPYSASDDISDNVYYSERIVWRSSPLLSVPSPLAFEKQEVMKESARKSPKLKEKNDGIAVSLDLVENAAVIVRPSQEKVHDFQSCDLSSVDDSVDLSGSGDVMINEKVADAFDPEKSGNDKNLDLDNRSEKQLLSGQNVSEGAKEQLNCDSTRVFGKVEYSPVLGKSVNHEDGFASHSVVKGSDAKNVDGDERNPNPKSCDSDSITEMSNKKTANRFSSNSGDGGHRKSDVGNTNKKEKNDRTKEHRVVEGNEKLATDGLIQINIDKGEKNSEIQKHKNQASDMYSKHSSKKSSKNIGCGGNKTVGDCNDSSVQVGGESKNGSDSMTGKNDNEIGRKNLGGNAVSDSNVESGASGVGGGDVALSCSRLSVEEEQALVIDLGTPNDNKAFVTTSTG